MPDVYMVRAGQGGRVVEEFQEQGCVAIGWESLTDLSTVGQKEDLRKLVDEAYADRKPGQRQSVATQVGRFLFGLNVGDPVLSYDTEAREYLVGKLTGKYAYEPGRVEGLPHVRTVDWQGRVSRDGLSVESRNTLGAIQTLFSVGDSVWAEISGLMKGEKTGEPVLDDDEGLEQLREDVLGRSHEFIKDRVQKLAWEEMQDLVAGILRAMGYKTHVTGKGSDRGKDIVASPDGLGLEHPRIRVEVKHRPKTQMGAPEVRSFIGALRQNDRGLYVSIGGFTREAHYEAERATVPITLLDLDDLVALLVQHYESLDPEARAFVPLMRVYWPSA